MKVLLYTGLRDNVIFYNTCSPPLGLYRIKNYLERRDIECDILDLSLSNGNFKDTLKKISDGQYDVIGLSVDVDKQTEYFKILLDIRSRVNKSGKKSMIVCGGQGGTHSYRSFIQKGKVDAVLLGFAEKSFYDLCVNFSKNKDKHTSFYSRDIPGVAFPKDLSCDVVIKNPSKTLTEKEFIDLNYNEIKDLYIPYKDYWDYTQQEGAAALNFKKSNNGKEKIEVEQGEADPHCDLPVNKDTQKFFVETIRLYTSSHCPWKCGFCSSHSFLRMSNATMEQEEKIPEMPKNGEKLPMNALASCGSQPHPVYRISPEQIYDIILRHCDKYDPKVFLFNDDAFWDGSTSGFKHIMDLCNLIIEGKKNGRINKDILFNCQAKIGDFIIKKPKRQLHTELIKKLKKAGFYHFGTGVETFAERLLRAQSINKKGNVSEKDQHMVIQGLLDHGFSPSVNIILFVPEQTVEELFYVMKIATEYMLKGTQIAMTPLLRPQEGSGIYELIRKGLTPIKAHYVEWKDPVTKEPFKYPLYCIPQDPQLASFLDTFQIKEYGDMIKISAGEQKRIVEKSGWNSKVVPRPVTALAVFITLSRYLKRPEWIKFFEDAVYQILARNNYAGGHQKLIEKESLVL